MRRAIIKISVLPLIAGVLFVGGAAASADEAAPPVVEQSTTSTDEVETPEVLPEPVAPVAKAAPAPAPKEVQQAPEKKAEVKEPVAKTEPQTNTNEGVCSDLGSGKIDWNGSDTTHVITADPGMLIDKYCVKAGSVHNGNGPEYVDVVPPAESVTISHSSGKGISHFSYHQIPKPHDECEDIPGDQPEGYDCDPDVTIEVPGTPDVTDPCGVGNAAWIVPADTDSIDWVLEAGELSANAKDGFVFEGGDKVKEFGTAPETNTDSCVPEKPEPIVTETSSTSYECGDDFQTTHHVQTTIDWSLVDNVWVQKEPVVVTWDTTETVDVVECPKPPEPEDDTPNTVTPRANATLPNTGAPSTMIGVAGALMALVGATTVIAARRRKA